MPVDFRRINGPESSTPYQIFVNAENQQTDIVKNVKESLKKRPDGREFNETRNIFAKTGIVSQAKGSAYVELGKTKLVCSVFDPREIPNKIGYSQQGCLYCEFKYAPFSCEKRRNHQQDAEEKEYSLIMQRSLEPAVCRHEFPNFQVDIYVLVLENDGACLGAAITAASLALANASIPMFGLVTAVTAGVYGNKTFIDPTIDEEYLCNSVPPSSNNHGIIMQATLPQHNQICELHFVGNIHLDVIKSTIEPLLSASSDLCQVVQQYLVKSVLKTLREKEKEKAEQSN